MNLDYLNMTIQNCPLCASSAFVVLNNQDRYGMGITTVGCKWCGLVQTNPRPSQSGLDLFYENDYRHFYQGVTYPDLEYIKKLHKHDRFKYTVAHLRPLIGCELDYSILDIGCSEGALFAALREDGYRGALLGVEVNKIFADHAKKIGAATVFPELRLVENACDLIVLNHVFEHLLTPGIFLKSLNRVLKDDGSIFIDVPDVDEYKSIDDLHVAHIFHYSLRTLSSMLQKSGFFVVSCEKHRPPFHPPSIRVVVKKSNNAANSVLCTASAEKVAWARVKKLSLTYKLLRSAIGKLPFARRIYKLFGKQK
jgi:SAM-dependent methyltransferase